MSRDYKFRNPEGLYFISFEVVGWLDVFVRNGYKGLFLESVRFCQKKMVCKYMRGHHVQPCSFGL